MIAYGTTQLLIKYNHSLQKSTLGMGTENKRTSYGQSSIEAFLNYSCREIFLDQELKAMGLSAV